MKYILIIIYNLNMNVNKTLSIKQIETKGQTEKDKKKGLLMVRGAWKLVQEEL